MTFRDTIKIEEKCTVYIQNKDTGKIEEIVIKKPWSEMSLFEKILHWLHIKRAPGTITTEGKEACGKLYGGASNGLPAYGAINRVSHNSGGWLNGNQRVCDIDWQAGKVVYDNEDNPWGATTNAQAVGLTNSGFYDYPYHSIDLSGTSGVRTSSSYNWWVKIELTIS